MTDSFEDKTPLAAYLEWVLVRELERNESEASFQTLPLSADPESQRLYKAALVDLRRGGQTVTDLNSPLNHILYLAEGNLFGHPTGTMPSPPLLAAVREVAAFVETGPPLASLRAQVAWGEIWDYQMRRSRTVQSAFGDSPNIPELLETLHENLASDQVKERLIADWRDAWQQWHADCS